MMHTRRQSHRSTLWLAVAAISGSVCFALCSPADEGQALEDAIAAFRGHSDVINAIAFSPDEKMVLTASFDHTLKLWDAATGKELRTFAGQNGHQQLVLSAAFSPDGQWIASGSADGNAKLWDVPQSAPLRQFVHAGEVNGVALSPDGKTVASACRDGTVRIWNAADGKELRSLGGPGSAMTGVSFNNNGQVVAASRRDGTLSVWNVADGKLLATIQAHDGPVTAVNFHPNGSLIQTTGRDGLLRMWQWQFTPPRGLPGHDKPITALALSPDAGRVISAATDRSIHISNVNGGLVRALTGAEANVTSIAAKDEIVIAGTADGHTILWDANNGQITSRRLAHDGNVSAVAIDPQRRGLLTAGRDGQIKFWPMPAGQPGRALPKQPAILAAIRSPFSRHVFTCGADKLIRRLNMDAGNVDQTYTGHTDAVTALCILPDGKLVSGSKDHSLRVWDANAVRQLATVSIRGTAIGVLPVAGVGQFVSAADDGTIQVWKIPNATQIAQVWQAAHGRPLHALAFDAAAQQLICGTDDGKIGVRGLADGKAIVTFQAHDGAVTGLAVDSQRKVLVSVGADGTAKLWSLPLFQAGGKSPERKPSWVCKLAGPAQSVGVSPDGKRIVVGVRKGPAAAAPASLIQVLDAAMGRPLMALDGHSGPVHALATEPDNRFLLSAAEDGSVLMSDIGIERTWDSQQGAVHALAYAPDGRVFSGGADKTVKQWDVNQAKAVRVFGPLDAAIRDIAVSRDSAWIGAAASKTVTIWDANGKVVHKLTHPAAVESLSFSPDRSRLVTGAADGCVRVWDLQSEQILEASRQSGPVRGVSYSNDNRVVIAGGDDGKVQAYTVSAIRATRVSAGPVLGLALASYGGHDLTAGQDHKVLLWNIGNGNRERALPEQPAPVTSVAGSRNNALIAVASADKTVRLYAFNNAQLVCELKTPGSVLAMAFRPDDRALAAACDDGSMLTWDVAYNPGQPAPPDFGKVVQTYAHKGAATSVVYSPDGRTLYSSSRDGTVSAWKVAVTEPRNLGHGREVDAVAFNHKGTQLATGSHDGLIRIWDVTNGNLVRQIQAHTQPMPVSVYCVAWSPDDSLIVSSSLDTSLKLWNAATGALVRAFPGYDAKKAPKGHREGVFCVAFRPDGKQIASGGSDRALRIWNVADGTVLREPVNPKLKPYGFPPFGPAHPGWVFNLRYTLDGKQLVSVSNGPGGTGSLAVWDADTGKLLATRDIEMGPCYAVAVSRDGKRLALGCGPRSGGQEASAYILKTPAPNVP